MSISYKYIQELHQHVLQDMPNDEPENSSFQDFTTVFSRDETVGLGMQIREFKGMIFVHAISCMNGNWLDSIEAVDAFLDRISPVPTVVVEKNEITEETSSSSMKELSRKLLTTTLIESNPMHAPESLSYEYSSDDTNSLDATCSLGPAGSAGILPGDCIVGAHGQSFHSLLDHTTTSTSFLAHVSQMIRETKDPIILHVRRYNTDPFTRKGGDDPLDGGVDLAMVASLDHHSSSNGYPKKKRIMEEDKNGTTTHFPIIQQSEDLSPPNLPHPYTPGIIKHSGLRNIRGRFIHSRKKTPDDDDGTHPFVRLLVEKGIVRGEDVPQILSEFQRITERALLWASMQDHEMPPIYVPSFEDLTPTQSFPSSSIHLYPASKLRQLQATRLNDDVSVIQSGFTTINKALSIRIVDSFLDGDKLAYTIWVYDVEKREEWYAPIRYTHDFVELREVTSRMSKYIEKIDFPSSGWFSTLASTEVSESQSSRDARCYRLETFLRELFKAIYLHPLTPNSAEIALYVQTFLGVDSCTERLIHFSPKFYATDKISIEQDTAQSQLLIAVQLYVYRIFLLGAMGRLVDTFISEIRGSFGSNTNVSRDGLENALRKIKSFLHQIQVLLFGGCIHDFRDIVARSEYSIDDSKDEKDFGEEPLFLEAIRSQVEVEVYIPLRSLISKDLTNLWRDDDIEVLRKIQVLKQHPQSYFIPKDYESPSEWKVVSQIMTIGLARQSLPCIKLNSLVNAGLSIPRLFEIEHHSLKESFSADIMLPIFIYAVVHADIDRPHALCALLRNICDPSAEIGIIGYYLSTFHASLSHIMELNV